MCAIGVSWRLLIGLGLLFFFVSSASTVTPEIERVKLGLDLLSTRKREELTKSVFEYANLAAALEHCGLKPDMERRVVAAVSACVKPETLEPFIKQYRSAKDEAMKAQDTLPVDVCSKREWQQLLKGNAQVIDNQVLELEHMCRSCKTCGD
jgi:hypothetical protein